MFGRKLEYQHHTSLNVCIMATHVTYSFLAIWKLFIVVTACFFFFFDMFIPLIQGHNINSVFDGFQWGFKGAYSERRYSRQFYV